MAVFPFPCLSASRVLETPRKRGKLHKFELNGARRPEAGLAYFTGP